jgi:hypothetical protein
MGKLKWYLFAAFFLSVVCSAADTSGQWQNALKPSGTPGPKLTLAKNGKSRYIVVISSQSTAKDQKAAGELQHWLEAISDVKIPIQDDSSNLPWFSHKISIGHTKYFDRLRNPLVKADLADEGYGIWCEGKDLYLWGGKTRGVINAVFALLEEDMGCRWYTDDAFCINKAKIVTVCPVPRTFSPKMRIRDPFYFVSFNAEWSLRNRTNAPEAHVPEEWGGRMDFGGFSYDGPSMFAHTFNILMPPDEFFQEHPEYYMLDKNGERQKQQLCTTNSNVIRIMTERVLNFLKKLPNTEFVSVTKNDESKTCQCSTCKTLDDTEGSNMASLLFLVNKVAEAVEREHPHVTVDTFAYIETSPLPKTMRPRNNVSIRLCNDFSGSWVHPFTPISDCNFSTQVKAWTQAHNQVYIWDYVVNFSHYMAPMPNMDVVAADIRFLAAHNVQGIMTQGAYQSVGAEREWQRSWIIAKLLWNPSYDLSALTQDFIYGYYGKAAPYIAEYDRLLAAQGIKFKNELSSPKGGIRFEMDNPFLSKDFLDKASQLFTQANQAAENDAIRLRVERAYLPILYVKLSRGPEFVGADYGDALERFKKISNQIHVTHLMESFDKENISKYLEKWKKQWADYNALQTSPQ